MARNVGLLVLLLLAAGSCFADIVNVTISGSINGTGTVGYVCGIFSSCNGQTAASSSFSLTGTNSALGTFGVSNGTSASTGPGGFTDTLTVVADQQSTVMGQSIGLELTEQFIPAGNLGGSPVLFESFWSASVTNDLSATFTLDGQAAVTLEGGAPGTAELLDSSGTVLLMILPGGTDSTVTLPAGTYTLTEDLVAMTNKFGLSDTTPVLITSSAGVSVVPTPEPKWSSAALGLLVGAVAFLYRRRLMPRA